MRPLILFIVISVSLYSCKTIILEDEQFTADVPIDIELIKIPAGIYISSEEKIEKYIDYDYSLMKFPVTNLQYIEYLKEASENGNINITSQSVTGYYGGDRNWYASIYEFVDFDDPDCRIGFYPPDVFVIKWTWVDGKKELYDHHPVTEVTWFGANAYAKYYGMRLPTKEEWEKAARANSGYEFSWGNDFDSTKVNFKNSGDIYDNNTTPIGYYNGENHTSESYSPYGIYDMTGNVWEWTESWKDQSPGKVLKGGSWRSKSKTDLYTWFESPYGYSPNNSSHDIGFRCVNDL